jgi:hypothetical protein
MLNLLFNILVVILFYDYPTPPQLHRPLAKFAMRSMSKNESEYKEMVQLAFDESNFNPLAISDKGACGLWQEIPKYFNTDCETLQKYHWKSAINALKTKRYCEKIFGNNWKKCYQRGPNHKSIKHLKLKNIKTKKMKKERRKNNEKRNTE